MTAREPISTALPAVITAPRRRRSHSTASSTNAVHARSPPPTLSKRSPSPRVSFTATQLSSDTKGVKNITRKVISTLEGLGHLEMVEQEGEYEEEEVERVLNALVGEGVVGGRRDRKGNGHYVNGNSKGDGYGPGIADKNEVKEKDTDIAVRLPDGGVARKKVDWEIPRKVLHSSIGTFSTSGSCCSFLMDCCRVWHNLPLRLAGQSQHHCAYLVDGARSHRACRYHPPALPPFRADIRAVPRLSHAGK